MNIGTITKLLRGPVVWVFAVLAVSGVTLWAARTSIGNPEATPVDWREADRVRKIEALAQRLDALLFELDRAPRNGSTAERAIWEDWVESDFRPRVKEFQRDILAGAREGSTPQSLLIAADRLGAAAANPGDDRARSTAHAARDALWAEVRADLARIGRP